MVLLNSADDFITELEQMFTLCKERGAGTVYTTIKKVEAAGKNKGRVAAGGSKEATGGGGRRDGWLARAKISNKKARKISLLVRRGATAVFLVELRLPTRGSTIPRLTSRPFSGRWEVFE